MMLDTRSNSNVLDHLMLELARYPNFGENHMLELARYPNFLMLAHPYELKNKTKKQCHMFQNFKA